MNPQIQKMSESLKIIHLKIKILLGEKLILGSDYTPDELSKPVGEVIDWVKCSCRGTGLIMTQNGEDDVNQEICDICSGEGWLPPKEMEM